MTSVNLNVNREHLARTIRESRQRRSLSQEQLAVMANVSLRTIQRLEKTGKCSHETLLALADVFDRDVREFTAILFTSTRKPMKTMDNTNHARKRLFIAGMVYVLALISSTAFLAISFSDHYSLTDRNMIANQDPYVTYLRLSAGILATGLVVLSFYTWIVYRKWFYGIVVLISGIILCVGSFSLLPWIYYPFDQYPAAAIWVFQWVPVMLLMWLMAGLLNRFIDVPSGQAPSAT